MNEAEAQEVQGELATTLRWEAVKGGGFRADLFTDNGRPSGHYSVTPHSSSIRVSRVYGDSSVLAYPKGFLDVEEAKAACERHHATYRWENPGDGAEATTAPLEWQPSTIGVTGGEFADFAGGRYAISREESEWKAHMLPTIEVLATVASWRKSVQRPLRRYVSAAAAKAACEHHHARGRWE